jgi:hypothetical protein
MRVLVLCAVIACGYPRPADVSNDGDGSVATGPADLVAFELRASENPSLPHDLAIERNGSAVGAIGFGIDRAALIAHFTVSAGATVSVAGQPQVSDVTANDFGHVQNYLVTSADGRVANTYTVAVSSRSMTITTAAGHVNQIAVATGDLDGDGRDEVVVAESTTGILRIYTNAASGDVITLAAVLGSPTASQPSEVVVTDVNGDHKPDLIVAQSQATAPVVVFRNTSMVVGTFAFSSAGTAASSGTVSGFAVGDLNGDGAPDLACSGAHNGVADETVYLNHGDGTFSSAALFTVGTSPGAVAVGDLDGDDVPDLAIADRSNLGAVWRLHNATVANGTTAMFVPLGTPTALGKSALMIANADFNGDGLVDSAIITMGVTSLDVVTTEPGSVFQNHTQPLDGQLLAFASTDFDADGRADLAVGETTTTASALQFLVGAPNIDLGPGPATTNLTTALQAIAVGDFNGDGLPDLVIVHEDGQGTITIARMLPGTPDP